MRRIIITTIILLATICQIDAQNITGTITDENGQPMEFVTVSLRSLPDSALVSGCITDENGQFSLERKDGGSFIQASSIGYRTLNIPVISLPTPKTFRMEADTRMLNEVVVTKALPKTKLMGDAVVTTISGSVLEHAGNSLEVLAKVPGMITKNGSLEVIGRGAPIYYINGRKVTDDSELRNLMSEDIRSIDVVTNPGAEYGGEVRSVVRIRTVKRQGDGFSYALTSQAQQRIYNNHDFDPSWSVLDLNYRKGGLDFIGKLVYYNQHNYQISDILGGTFIKMPDGSVKRNVMEGPLNARVHNSGMSGDLGVNWQMNENHSLGMKLNYGKMLFDDQDLVFEDDVYTDNEFIDHVRSVSHTKMPSSHTFTGNLYYDGNINKLNVNFNADFSNSDYKKETSTDESSLNDPAAIKNNSKGAARMGAGKLVLSHPIWKGVFKIGTEETYVSADQDYSSTHVDIPSSKAKITENTISGFAEYALPFKYVQMVAGIRYEHVDFEYTNECTPKDNINRVHNNWFPSFNASTKLGPIGVNLGYTTKIRRPRYEQLSTEIQYNNRFSYQTGDPTLLNEIQNTLSLNANWKWLTLTGAYEVVDNAIYQLGYPYNDDFTAMIKYSNAKDAVQKLNIYLNASPSFGIWNPRYTVGMEKQFFETTVIDPREATGTRVVKLNDPMFFLQANNAFKLKQGWLFDLDYQYTSPFCYVMYKFTKPTHSFNIAVSKSFLKHDALNVRLSWNDILNKTVNHINTDYGNFFNKQSNDSYSPCVQLRLSYRFNTANSKYKGTGAGQDAKSRM
ncbi:MAG: TonB-dependent receptor family protein [Bacteroidaceae bacterium]|nr:TonB-dependent receptor family protein [Bacteroidaceae bacterium]